LYLEEYFLKKITTENPLLKIKYIPALWTNFQIKEWFESKKEEMQNSLNKWLQENPSENGYFTIVQHDDGPQLNIPANTIIYGACSGNIQIPLIYQDINNTLTNIPKKSFSEKQILCSFIGNITSNHIQPNVRDIMKKTLSVNRKFIIFDSGGWTPSVDVDLQKKFVDVTRDSKFALAPRGYGRGSFRFFECFQLGTIPIYLWNDIEWLPFKNVIDYSRLCISLHISQINSLEQTLESITEDDYNKMFEYYNEIKHLFELEGMSNQIIKEINN
jgi:hypothetical protein